MLLEFRGGLTEARLPLARLVESYASQIPLQPDYRATVYFGESSNPHQHWVGNMYLAGTCVSINTVCAKI